jgi:transcriptional regulator with XRE-family HTH domain
MGSSPILLTFNNVVELSVYIEFLQYSIVKLMVQEEIIPMTPEQTVKLMSLLETSRNKLNLSVNEVARRAKVDPATAWRIEQGMIASPKADSLLAMGKVLGIPAMELFCTVGWLTAEDLPDVGTYLRTKFEKLPVKAVQDIERYADTVLYVHGQSALKPHSVALTDHCAQQRDHCPQCPCATKEYLR